jgi:HSP20 family protein
MRNQFDRVFENFGLRTRGDDDLGIGSLGVDVYETEDAYVVRAPVAGVNPDDLDINIDNDVLTISGETRTTDEARDDQFIRRELRYGSFRRALRLPPTVDTEQVDATVEHGMLELRLPKKAESRPRSIKVTPRAVLTGEHGDDAGQGQQG